MTNIAARHESIRLMIRAINCLLVADGASYRVTDGITITRRDGFTILAIREVTPAEAVEVRPPVVNLRARS